LKILTPGNSAVVGAWHAGGVVVASWTATTATLTVASVTTGSLVVGQILAGNNALENLKFPFANMMQCDYNPVGTGLFAGTTIIGVGTGTGAYPLDILTLYPLIPSLASVLSGGAGTYMMSQVQAVAGTGITVTATYTTITVTSGAQKSTQSYFTPKLSQLHPKICP
jgi:hypothetical protein